VRGDVHAIKGPKDARGREQRGRRFAVVIQSDDLMGLSTVIVALTSTLALPSLTRPEVGWDGTPTRVMVEQMTAVDWSRLGDVVGHLSHDEMQAVDDAIRDVLFV
jgi:mRNA interferase MazF